MSLNKKCTDSWQRKQTQQVFFTGRCEITNSIIERWWPVAYDFGLVRAPLDTVLEATQAVWRQAGLEIGLVEYDQPLEDFFKALEPLSSTPTKEMYLSTRFGWTAFFRNAVHGSDPFVPMSKLSRALQTTAMRVCVTPANATYAAVIWEVYDTPAQGGNKWGYRRSIAAANDGGSWVFETSGEPFPFEDTARYAARLKRDRFTKNMLKAYLAEFGIPHITDEDFLINSTCKGGIFARTAHKNSPVYTLEEALHLKR